MKLSTELLTDILYSVLPDAAKCAVCHIDEYGIEIDYCDRSFWIGYNGNVYERNVFSDDSTQLSAKLIQKMIRDRYTKFVSIDVHDPIAVQGQ